MAKELTRSTTNKVIAGVCGGIGEYFDVDPVFVRIVTVILAFATGFGLIGYIVAWIIMPKNEPTFAINGETVSPENNTLSEKKEYSSWNRYLPGLILMGIGVVLLVRDHWYWFDWSEFWPVVLILIGLSLIFRRKNKQAKEAMNNGTEQMTNGNNLNQNGGSVS